MSKAKVTDKKKPKAPRIELTGGYYMTYSHDQYFWIGSDEPGTSILCSVQGTSPRRFAKQVLAVRAAIQAERTQARKGKP